MTLLILAFTVLAVVTCIVGIGHYLNERRWTGAGMILAGLAMSFVPFLIVMQATLREAR